MRKLLAKYFNEIKNELHAYYFVNFFGLFIYFAHYCKECIFFVTKGNYILIYQELVACCFPGQDFKYSYEGEQFYADPASVSPTGVSSSGFGTVYFSNPYPTDETTLKEFVRKQMLVNSTRLTPSPGSIQEFRHVMVLEMLEDNISLNKMINCCSIYCKAVQVKFNFTPSPTSRNLSALKNVQCLDTFSSQKKT